MKSVLFFILTIALCNAFQLIPSMKLKQRSTVCMNSFPREFAKALTIASLVISSPVTSYAASYGSFGSSSPAVVDPKTAAFDEEYIKSEDFKAGVSGLKQITETVANLQSSLNKDSNTDIVSQIPTVLNIAKVRQTLNKFNNGFSEDTQRGTDRLIRVVLQDITELEREATVKSGKERSPQRTQIVLKRLAATESALNDLAAFSPLK